MFKVQGLKFKVQSLMLLAWRTREDRVHCRHENQTGLRLVMDDETFLTKFEAQSFPHDQWHHREHIKMAYLYLRQCSFDAALAKIRAGIQALNASQKVPENPTRGYHETLTQAWLRLVQVALCEYGPAESADAFYEQHPELSQHKVLRLFYSPDRLMSPRAKAEFVEPDLAPLPESRKKAIGLPAMSPSDKNVAFRQC